MFVLIKKVKWNGFIQIITWMKWLRPVTLVFHQTIRVGTQSRFPDFVDFVRISKISQDNHYVNPFVPNAPFSTPENFGKP